MRQCDGVAYVFNLIRLLDTNNLPRPVGLVLSEEMFNDLEHAYPALVDRKMAWFNGIKIYRDEE